MKKFLLLSVALLSVLFLTFTGCKKKETTPTSLNGTTWALSQTAGGITGKIEIVFASSGNTATLKNYLNDVEQTDLNQTGTFTYADGKGSLTPNGAPAGYPFTVSGNKLTINATPLEGGKQEFTRQ